MKEHDRLFLAREQMCNVSLKGRRSNSRLPNWMEMKAAQPGHFRLCGKGIAGHAARALKLD